MAVQELSESIDELFAQGEKADAIGRVAWALLASMEFGVNH